MDRVASPAAAKTPQRPVHAALNTAGADPMELTLQWAVGILCLLVGALMLVAPHQFTRPVYVVLRPQLAWWGAGFELAGVGLFGTLLLGKQRWLRVAACAAAGGVLLLLAIQFLAAGSWTGTVNYASLGAGTALAPLISRLWRRWGSAGARIDLLALVLGLANAVTGSLMIGAPERFGSATYDSVRPFLLGQGAVYLIGGLLLVTVHLRPRVPRWAFWAAHLLAAAPLVPFLAMALFPDRRWTGIVYYGEFSLVLAVLPWLAARLRGFDAASLRARLAFALAAAAMVPLVLATAVDADRETRAVTHEALSHQEAMAVALARDVADYVGLYRAAVSALAAQPGLAQMAPDEQRAVVRAFGSAYSDAASFNIFDAEGTNLARSDDRPLTSVGGSSLFESARRNLAPSVDIRVSPLLHRPVFRFGAPVRDQQGHFAGLVNTTLESSRLAEVLARAHADTGTRAYLVDADGRAIAHPDTTSVATFADLSDSRPVAAQRADPDQEGSVEYADPAGDQLAGYARVPELGWGVIVERPSALVLASERAGRDTAFELLFVVILAAAAFGTLVAARLAAPLRALARVADRLAEGDDAVPLPRTEITEIARLTAAFEAMRADLAARTAEREQQAAQLEQWNRDLEHTVAERTAALAHQALHDQLTGLPNRTLLHQRLQQTLLARRREDQMVAC